MLYKNELNKNILIRNIMSKTILMISTLPIWPFMDLRSTQVIYHTIKIFFKRGYNIKFLFLHKPTFLDDEIKNKITLYHTNTLLFKKLNELKYIRFLISPFYWLIIQIFFLIYGMFILSSNDIDFIYSWDFHSAPAAYILSKLYKKKCIFRYLGSFIGARCHSIIYKFRYWREVLAYKLNGELYIMTDDGTCGDKVLEYFGINKEKIIFLKNGVDYNDNNDFEHNKQEYIIKYKNSYILLCVSRLDYWKRVDRSILLIKELLKRNINVILIIVGDGADKCRLLKLVNDYNLKNNVIFLGNIDNRKLKSIYLKCDLFLSLYDLSNVCNPVLEAMAYGCCVVALNNGGIDKIITNGKNGITIDFNNYCKLTEIIIDLLINENKRKTIGKNASEYIKKYFYTWHDRINMEIDIIEKYVY